MRVKVQTVLDLVQLLGSREVELEMPPRATVRSAIACLVSRFGTNAERKLINPSSGEPYPYLRLVLNGRDIAFLNGLDTVMDAGDTLIIIPPAAGG